MHSVTGGEWSSPFRTLLITWTLSMLSLSYICQTEIRPVWYQIEVRSRWIQALIMKKERNELTRIARDKASSCCQISMSITWPRRRKTIGRAQGSLSMTIFLNDTPLLGMTEICGFVSILLFSAKILAGKDFCDCECRLIHLLIPKFRTLTFFFLPFYLIQWLWVDNNYRYFRFRNGIGR